MMSSAVAQYDTVDKIVGSYFTSMTVEPFMYKGRSVHERPLVVSPLLFRGLICPEGCGACCPSFTLDYLPSEAPFDRVHGLEPFEVEFNQKRIPLFRFWNDPKAKFCAHLNMETARCTIHEVNPLSCSFEIMRFLVSEDQARFLVRYFGRSWAMLRIDGERGARCGLEPWNNNIQDSHIRQIKRLRNWMRHFGLNPRRTYELQDWIETGPHEEFLTLK
jgi:hypothetical protein